MIAVATAEAEVILASVSKVADAAEVVKAEVAKIKQAAEVLVEEIAIDTKIAKGKLEAAQPALDEAEAALNVCFSPHLLFVSCSCQKRILTVNNRPSAVPTLPPYENWASRHISSRSSWTSVCCFFAEKSRIFKRIQSENFWSPLGMTH